MLISKHVMNAAEPCFDFKDGYSLKIKKSRNALILHSHNVPMK